MNKFVNPDLAKERHNNMDVKSLVTFLGENRFNQPGKYNQMVSTSIIKFLSIITL